MRNITGILSKLSSYQTIRDDIKNSNTPVFASGIIDVQNTHVMAALTEELQRPALIIAENDIKAREIYENLYFFNKNTVMFDARDIIFYSADVHSRDTDTKRLSVLKNLVEGEKINVVVPVDAVFDKIIPPNILKNSVVSIKEGEEYNTEDLIEKLIYMGYERCETAESKGQFSVRGGIIDIYPSVSDTAF